ncbi:COP9 signalosome complex subunit 7 [Striga hermonthica]|uniref:COP9 signalosome complex subunit 7 n=1 Tax=Striga hermonthica TaxID=68872 RepID=A0A9N7R6I2_STRHE|nr:COP9 signalosome complex subunit 7 [Striga hermonthica]
MDIEEKQAEHVEFFVKQASGVNGAALSNVVVEATKHPSLFAFSELLAVPSVLELEGTENSVFLDLLRMFAHGTWSEYKTIEKRLPQLVPEQVLKLKQLTVLTLADTNKVLPYDMLMRELDVSNVRELEDFLINDCMYVGIIRGKLDQLRRCFEVQFAAGRDLRPGQLGLYLTILPLIWLVSYHSNLGPQLHEPKTAEWFGKDVCELQSGFDKLQKNLSSIDTITDEVKTGIDVLTPVMEDWIFCKGNGGLVVHHQSWCTSFLAGQFAQQPTQPDRLACRYGCRHVLCLARRQRYNLLFQRLP